MPQETRSIKKVMGSSYISFISSMINWKLTGIKKEGIDEYLYQTFDSFSNHKNEIFLNLDELQYVDGDMISLIMYGLKERGGSSDKDRNKLCLCSSDFNNIFIKNILDIFINLNNIKIYTTDGIGWKTYSLCLLSLLSLMDESRVQRVEIMAVQYFGTNNSWISCLWSLCSSEIESKFNAKSKEIAYKQIVNSLDRKEDWLIIDRM